MLSSTQIGRAAEFLVCYTLQLNGIECYHVNSTTDVIATVGSGRLIRLEVKAASAPRPKAKTYHYLASRTDNSDWYALVALDIGLMLFMPTSHITTKMITIQKSEFTAERQAETLQQLGAEI
jgi:hypothetical protein